MNHHLAQQFQERGRAKPNADTNIIAIGVTRHLSGRLLEIFDLTILIWFEIFGTAVQTAGTATGIRGR